jgi:hypothetical protein
MDMRDYKLVGVVDAHGRLVGVDLHLQLTVPDRIASSAHAGVPVQVVT